LKSVFNKKIIANNDVGCSFGKFGANGFYASPAAIDQYEETTASLVGFQRLSKKVILLGKVYMET
jgi:iron complex outermembrane receptor protein